MLRLFVLPAVLAALTYALWSHNLVALAGVLP